MAAKSRARRKHASFRSCKQLVNYVIAKLFTDPACEEIVHKKRFPFATPRDNFAAFLDRTVAVRRYEKSAESTTGIIPGDRGKEGGSWCHLPLRSG
jgi:hypothetical protein